MQDKSPRHVVIIGSGPAGIAAAACLQKEGIPYTLLESGSTPLASLRRIDPSMELLSPTLFNSLPHMQRRAAPSYQRFGNFISELECYIADHRVIVRTNCPVAKVVRSENRFIVHIENSETFQATHVINATGIIANQRFPASFVASNVSFRWKHSLDVRADDLKDVRTLVVIGGGASAAEVLDTWLSVRPSDSHAYLSLRTKLKAFTNPILGLDIHYWIWLHEQLPASLLGRRALKFPEYMNGTRVLPAIKQGLISCVGDVEEYTSNCISLKSGLQLFSDLVVFATGFKYSTEHLKDVLDFYDEGQPRIRNCESTKTKNLFLLGFKFGRTFASPYIRGIARDAKYIVRRIANQ